MHRKRYRRCPLPCLVATFEITHIYAKICDWNIFVNCACKPIVMILSPTRNAVYMHQIGLRHPTVKLRYSIILNRMKNVIVAQRTLYFFIIYATRLQQHAPTSCRHKVNFLLINPQLSTTQTSFYISTPFHLVMLLAKQRIEKIDSAIEQKTLSNKHIFKT